jgi:phosphatidylglycerophosphatase A
MRLRFNWAAMTISAPETEDAPPPRLRPTLAWMLRDPARIIACGFGSGLIRPAPGTWGTLFGWATFVLFAPFVPEPWRLAVVVLAFVIGVYACGRAGRDLGVVDHGGFVWDEVVAIWLVLALVPQDWPAQLAAFLAFRLFDILKPQPIRYFDAKLKSGFGVMFDDLLAAFYTLLVFALHARIFAHG